MKPIEKNEFSSSILGVKLYLDDIELIISKIQNLSDNFQISDDDNIYQSIEELREFKGDNPRKIKIENRKEFSYIFIGISDDIANVTCSGELFLKEAYEIEKIFIERKKSPTITYFFNPINARNNLIVVTLLLATYYAYKTFYLKQITDFKGVTWVLVIWGTIFLVTLLNPNFNRKIELKRRHETGFWKKNQDNILTAIISIILTAIISYLIQKND